MTVCEFIKQDEKMQKEKDQLMKKLHKLEDKRADLQITLDKESHRALWKELEGKALKDYKGAMWEFKKLKKICGEWYVTLAYSKPGEVSANLDRNLANCLQWLSNYDMELVEFPVKCSVIENYIKDRKRIKEQKDKLNAEHKELSDKIKYLKTELHKGKKKDCLRFLKAHKIVSDKGTYTVLDMYRDRIGGYTFWMVIISLEKIGGHVSDCCIPLDTYLDYCCLEGARLESV